MTNYEVERAPHRWAILIVSTIGLVISNGLAIGGIPVFYKPVLVDFLSAGVVPGNAAQSFTANGAILTFLMSGVFSFVGGWLIPRFGIRRLMIFGAVCLGAAFVVHAQAESVTAVYVSRFLMGASLGFVGVTPSVVLVSSWFGRRRGAAIGVLLTGTSIGGFVMPVVFAKMIAVYEWRLAMLFASGFVWLVLLPMIVLIVKDSASTDVQEPSIDTGLTLNEALRSGRFWIFASCAALVFYTIFVTTQQFILYLQSPRFGLSLAIASGWQSLLFGLSVTGKSAAGLLSDRFSPNRLTLWSTAMMFASTLALLVAGAPFLFLLIYGLGYGATFVLLQRLVADYFGRRDYGRILGLITMIEIFGGVIGGSVTGRLADQSGGDYSTAFHVMILVTAGAFICMVILNVWKTNEYRHAS